MHKHASACDRSAGHSGGSECGLTSDACPWTEYPYSFATLSGPATCHPYIRVTTSLREAKCSILAEVASRFEFE